MGKIRFSYLFGLFFIALLSTDIVVHGQSQDTSTSTSSANSEQIQGTPSLPQSSPEASSSTEFYPTSSTPSSVFTTENVKLSDCKTPTDLKVYCANTITPQEMDFFNNDTSIMGVLAKILSPRIVYALQEQCVPGNWCLANSYQKEISDGKSYFYTTPICVSDRVWRCLENIQISRRECNENELIFLMSAIGLMCDMNAIDGGVISSECFTRSIEALHVLYSDISRNLEDKEKENSCSSYNKQMTNTYACAVNACNMEQRVFLEDFGPWSHISSIAENVLETCDMNLQCQGGYPTQSAPVSGSTNSQYPSSEPTSDLEKALSGAEATEENKIINEEIEEIEAVIAAEEAIGEMEGELLEGTTPSYIQTVTDQDSGEEIINEQGMDIPESQEDVDQTFVYGMVTVTVVVVISLTLMGVMAFKRFSRMRKNYKMGYSQMTEEESRMLRNEYN